MLLHLLPKRYFILFSLVFYCHARMTSRTDSSIPCYDMFFVGSLLHDFVIDLLASIEYSVELPSCFVSYPCFVVSSFQYPMCYVTSFMASRSSYILEQHFLEPIDTNYNNLAVLHIFRSLIHSSYARDVAHLAPLSPDSMQLEPAPQPTDAAAIFFQLARSTVEHHQHLLLLVLQ
jgi:hypothetical protein